MASILYFSILVIHPFFGPLNSRTYLSKEVSDCLFHIDVEIFPGKIPILVLRIWPQIQCWQHHCFALLKSIHSEGFVSRCFEYYFVASPPAVAFLIESLGFATPHFQSPIVDGKQKCSFGTEWSHIPSEISIDVDWKFDLVHRLIALAEPNKRSFKKALKRPKIRLTYLNLMP